MFVNIFQINRWCIFAIFNLYQVESTYDQIKKSRIKSSATLSLIEAILTIMRGEGSN